MFWLILLGAVTLLVISLRRVLRRMQPLNDELYSNKIAIVHVHSGVAWVREDGTIASTNPSIAGSFGAKYGQLEGRQWLSLFEKQDRPRVEDAHRQALLSGRLSLEASVQRLDGSRAYLDFLILTVHDHKLRYVGHHLLTSDRTREHALAEQVQRLRDQLAQYAEPHRQLDNIELGDAETLNA